MANKKGVSDIISTVLIILLVVAAIAIIAAVVLNIVRQAPGQVNAAADCQKLIQDVSYTCKKGSGLIGSNVTVSRGYQNKDVVFSSFDAVYTCWDGRTQSKTNTSVLNAGSVSEGTSTDKDCNATSAYIIPTVKVGGSDTKCQAPLSPVTCS